MYCNYNKRYTMVYYWEARKNTERGIQSTFDRILVSLVSDWLAQKCPPNEMPTKIQSAVYRCTCIIIMLHFLLLSKSNSRGFSTIFRLPSDYFLRCFFKKITYYLDGTALSLNRWIPRCLYFESPPKTQPFATLKGRNIFKHGSWIQIRI